MESHSDDQKLEPIQTTQLYIQNQDTYYENQVEKGVEQRSYSKVLFVNLFNNFIKAVLIDKYGQLAGRNPSVFDLCCGKGGDYFKWTRLNPSHYVGLDYSKASLELFLDRIKDARSTIPCMLIVADAGDENSLVDRVLREHFKLKDVKQPVVFDLVSCQFSMHYMFDSERRVRAFLKNVADRLEPGGYFIGTTVDAERVVGKVLTEGKEKLRVGNDYYQIQLLQESFPVDYHLGLKYYFYLQESVGNDIGAETDEPVFVPEYFVVFDKFEELAKEYGLKLLEKKNLLEWYRDSTEQRKYQDTFEKMVRNKLEQSPHLPPGDFISQQWEICSLYLAFAFVKEGQKRFRKRGNFGNFKAIFNRGIADAKEWV